MSTVKPVLSGHSKRTSKIGFQYRLWLNACQTYCRMLQGEHSAILSTFIKLPLSIVTFALSIFKWPLKTGFTVTDHPCNFCRETTNESFLKILVLVVYASRDSSEGLVHLCSLFRGFPGSTHKVGIQMMTQTNGWYL